MHQRWQQIGERLARAGTRFGELVSASLQGSVNLLRHVHLTGTSMETGHLFRERSIRRQHSLDELLFVLDRFRCECVFPLPLADTIVTELIGFIRPVVSRTDGTEAVDQFANRIGCAADDTAHLLQFAEGCAPRTSEQFDQHATSRLGVMHSTVGLIEGHPQRTRQCPKAIAEHTREKVLAIG